MSKTRLAHRREEDGAIVESAKRVRRSPNNHLDPKNNGELVDPTPSRPNEADRAAARVIIKQIEESPFKTELIGARAKRCNEQVVALAFAMHMGDEFESDRSAKDLFGVGRSTEVRRDWADGKLKALFEHHPLAEAAAIEAGCSARDAALAGDTVAVPAAPEEPEPKPRYTDGWYSAPPCSTSEWSAHIREHMCSYALALQHELESCRCELATACELLRSREPEELTKERCDEWAEDWEGQVEARPWEKVASSLFNPEAPFSQLQSIVRRHPAYSWPVFGSCQERTSEVMRRAPWPEAGDAGSSSDPPPAPVTTLVVRDEAEPAAAARARPACAVRVQPAPRGDKPPAVASFDY